MNPGQSRGRPALAPIQMSATRSRTRRRFGHRNRCRPAGWLPLRKSGGAGWITTTRNNTTAHGRMFNPWRAPRISPRLGAGSPRSVCDASPVATIQCCEVQTTIKRNKLRGRRAIPTITAMPRMYKTRGNDHRDVRSSANNAATVTTTSTRVAPSRIGSCADTIHAGKNQ